MSQAVIVREVAPRDGLQLVRDVMSTTTKSEWITRQADAGFSWIEVTSFVLPKLMPQFADAAVSLLHGEFQRLAMPTRTSGAALPN